MKDTYSFLLDELALNEIRKHKWLESEKNGREVGFATAALDWIKKHGSAWKRAHLRRTGTASILKEKRRHRRFQQRFPLKIEVNNALIEAQTDTVSLMGLSCTVPTYIADNTATTVTIRFQDSRTAAPKARFLFNSRIRRVKKEQNADKKQRYNIFLPFSEEVKDFLRAEQNVLNN